MQQVNIAEWNAAIFREAVVRTGRPDDPLYLYVDEDTLAVASGLSPDAAVDDFCVAFNRHSVRMRFKIAMEKAVNFSAGEAEPPFVYALAMTVLGATLPAIGNRANVYSRQRRLLGLSEGVGAPDGYTEYVPRLWMRWNEWLEDGGRIYGTPTARQIGNWTYQGWARSQSFIRSADKEYVLAYFETLGRSDGEFDPMNLLVGLRSWLAPQVGVSQRLLERVNDPDYEDEFGRFLSSSWRSWAAGVNISRLSTSLDCRLVWEDETGRFELIVDPDSAHLLRGREVTALDRSTYSVVADVYVTGETQPASEWFDSELRGWELAEGVRISWAPRSLYVLAKQSHRMIDLHSFDNALSIMVVYREELEDDVVASAVRGTSAEAPVSGWRWIRTADLANADRARLADLAGVGRAADRSRRARFGGGLRLSHGNANIFLEQGEPDLIIHDPASVSRVDVDGRSRLAELELVSAEAEGIDGVASGQHVARLRIADLVLNPGEHRVEIVREDGYVSKLAFESHAPAVRPTPTNPGSSPTKRHPARSLRLIANQSFLVYSGAKRVDRLEFRLAVPRWLSEVGLPDDAPFQYYDLADVPAPAPSVLVAQASTGERPRWVAVCLEAQRRGSGWITASTSSPKLLAGFVSAPPPRIESDGIDPQQLKADLFAAAMNEQRSPIERTGLADRNASTLPTPLRTDLKDGVSNENPYNDLLDWLSECGASVGHSRVIDAVHWLWSRRGQRAVNSRDILERLEALGHVEHDRIRQRISISPTSVAALPDASGWRVLLGARPSALAEALISGEAEWLDYESPAAAFLQNIEFQSIAPVHGDSAHGPDAWYIRWPSFRGDSFGLGQLGIRDGGRAFATLLERIPDLADRLEQTPRFDAPVGVQPKRFRWKPLVGRSQECRGTWRDWKPGDVESAGFERIDFGRFRRYIVSRPGHEPKAIGWTWGRWWYESTLARRSDLLHYRPHEQRLMMTRELTLPMEVRQALIARSGLLPRRARLDIAGTAFDVFENIDERTASLVARRLGFPAIEPAQGRTSPLRFVAADGVGEDG